MASAPALTAAPTSCSRVNPQILIRVRIVTLILNRIKGSHDTTRAGQSPALLILSADKIESIRCERWGRNGPVASSKEMGKPFRRFFFVPYPQQRADNIAHHVMQEAASMEIEYDIVPTPCYP